MEILGSVSYDHPLVAKPTGLEQLDYEEILRQRYLGVWSGDPKSHLLGTNYEATFVGSKLEPLVTRHLEQIEGKLMSVKAWKEAYYEIGQISSWLGLPSYVRDEMTRIYAHMRKRGKTVRTGINIEKVLAKIAYLACLVHKLPRRHQDLEREMRELYGFGFGKIPQEFIKALNTRQVKFSIFQPRNRKQQYLYAWETIGGKRWGRCLGQL